MKTTAKISLALFLIYVVLYYYTTPTTLSDDLVAISAIAWLGSFGVLLYQVLTSK